ncbi:uncharacterized protein METZ01_LOCUS51236 [marine metagenome]|uniref:Uncharacterized protein n=1 Tax=marine metagenome TaxID=408172 RepID=A0A381S2S8_9ZZZZ
MFGSTLSNPASLKALYLLLRVVMNDLKNIFDLSFP